MVGAAGQDLPIIAYSARKRLTSDTLSKIRSHAQHYVQGQRGRGKGARKIPKQPRTPSAPKGNMTTFCTTIVFDGVEAEAAKPVRRPRRVRKDKRAPIEQPKEDIALANREPGVSLVLPSPTQELRAAFDPFDAFPVMIDGDFVILFEGYHKAWKWKQSKEELFTETVSNATLCHSWLAIAYTIAQRRRNNVKSIEHEIATIDNVYAGLSKLGSLPAEQRQDLSFTLTWAILRLAMIKAHQGKLQEVRDHMNALASIAPSREAIQQAKFGDHLQSTIAVLLLFNVSQQERINAAVQYPYGTYEEPALGDVEAQGFAVPLASPLLHSSLAGLVDDKVLDCLKALTALCQRIPTSENIKSPTATHSKEQAIGFIKIGLRLADLPLRDDDDPGAWNDELQECLTLSALTFIWCFGRRKDAHADAVNRVRDQLREKITPELICRTLREAGRLQPLVDLMVWMLIVCGSTSKTEDDKLYYSGLLRVLAPKYLDRSFEELEDWGRLMPWIRGCSSSPVDEFWELTTGRKSPTKDYDLERERCLRLLGQRRMKCPSIFG